MRIEDLNWFDVENYLKKEDRMILIMGSCEQHGYLSLLCDVKIPQALADAASERSGVLIAPPINFGCSPYFMNYPGTLSIRATTLFQITEDILRSAYRQGFRRILILNGHGGNNTVTTRIYELLDELPEMQVKWYSWWLSNSVSGIAQKYEIKPSHANWLEAFSFTRVTEMPAEEKIPPVIPGMISAAKARKIYGDGSFGGAYQVEDTIMEEIFNACLFDILKLLEFND
ncbi:MAG: creatininase family protein [Chloroflexi bacterium]|nr:creatininase family protein [Chloroflexota bacterium]